MSLPAFVLVGGLGCPPVFFEATIKEFNQLGYEAHAPALPTIGYKTEGMEAADEVKVIEDSVASFVNQGKDVVLVTHSYGGWPASCAISGWDKYSREEKGLKNGIIEVVFVGSPLIPTKENPLEHAFSPPWLKVQDGVGILTEDALPVLFIDLDEAGRKRWFAEMRPHRRDFTASDRERPWDLPLRKTFILLSKDPAALLQRQLAMLGEVINDTWQMKSLRTDHMPMLSAPKRFTEALLSKPL